MIPESTDTSSELAMPQPEVNGFVKTLNNMGYMTSGLDLYSQAFVDFSVRAPGPSLDVGAAYGVATLQAIERGSNIIANDIDPRHLEILKSRVSEKHSKQLEIMPGEFPYLDVSDGTLGAILVCRVLHFFDGPKIELAARQMFKWLNKDGKVFIVAETPYLRNFSAFIPIYENRKRQGSAWPGFIEDVMAVAPERGAFLPPQMHLLDPDVLSRVFQSAGFEIEKSATFPRPEFPEDIQFDGRESVGLIAVKR